MDNMRGNDNEYWWINLSQISGEVQKKWHIVCGDICDSPRFVFNMCHYYIYPCIEITFFALKGTLCTDTWNNKYHTMDTLRQI